MHIKNCISNDKWHHNKLKTDEKLLIFSVKMLFTTDYYNGNFQQLFIDANFHNYIINFKLSILSIHKRLILLMGFDAVLFLAILWRKFHLENVCRDFKLIDGIMACKTFL